MIQKVRVDGNERKISKSANSCGLNSTLDTRELAEPWPGVGPSWEGGVLYSVY